ncbi:MAG: PAS domain S-box protein [Deltaproteobacteria bacterium]|nr:PAS domain S-box protein [Deltaproteobacteria bacterium]
MYKDQRIAGWRENYVYKLPSGEIVAVYDDITERKQAEEILIRSEEKFAKAFHHGPTLMTISSIEDGKYTEVNENFVRVTGYGREESIGTTSADLGFISEEDFDELKQELIKNGRVDGMELALNKKNGDTLYCQYFGEIITIDGKQRLLSIASDITDRKHSEERIEHVNLVLLATRNVNQLITKEKDRDKLLQGVCNNLVETRGYYNAWIALFDESGKLLKTTEAGLGDDFLPMLERLKRGELTDCGRTALSQSDVVVTEDPSSTCADCPLAEKYSGRGAMTIRLAHEGKVYGLLSVSIAGHLTVYKEEKELFREVTEDIAYALYNMEQEDERKRMDMALKASEGKYRSLVETITDIVFIIDTNGRLIFLNPEFENLTGYPAQDFIGHPFTEILSPEYIESTVDRFKRGLSGETIPIYEVELKHMDGKTVPVELKVTSMIDDDGQTIGRIGVARDISERKRAERTLTESEERYRSVFENTGTATVIIEDDMTISMANAEYENLTGFSKEEVENKKKWTEFVVGEDLEKMKEYHIKRRGNDANVPTEYEFRFVDKQGNVKDVYLKVGIIPGTARTVASVADVTSLKRTQEALKESEEKYRPMMEAMKEPVYICSSDYRVEYMNPAMIKRIGRDATGEYCFKALHDLDEKCSWCMHNKAQQGEYFESDIVSPKDNRSCQVSHSPIVHGDGSISKMTIFRDTTDLKKLEAQLRQAQKMEAVGNLAGGIAHDFNNVMQIISGYAQILLLDKEEGSRDFNMLQGIEKSVERGVDLIRGLLVFGRKVESNLSPVELNHEITQVSRILDRTIPKMINIELHLSEDLKTVNADPVQIEQIMMNLSVNARDAMPDGGRLIFETENVVLDEEYCKTHLETTPGEYVLLSILDTGYGMDEETLEHMFEPFFTTKETGKGTGLGLAMVYGIVKGHGGNITCYSKPGEGTTFKIYLPVLEAEGKGREAERKVEEEIPGGSEKILLVDDEETILDIVRNMLDRSGYTVITAESGEEAVEVYRAEKEDIDLVILDVNMPGMGGHKCLKGLIKIDPEVKVIIATGYTAAGKVKETLESGAAGFIGKPYRLAEILKKIREVLDKDS